MKQNNEPSAGLFEKVFEEEQQKRVERAESEARQEEAKLRTESKRRRRSAARIVTTFLLVVAVLAVLFGAIYFFFFRISDMRVVGSVRYSSEDIFKVAGVSKGDHLYSFSSRVAGDRLKKYLPYIKSLTVKRDMPGTITFTVEEYSPRFYSFVYGRTCVLSGDLTVLELSDGTDRREDLCFLALPAVKRAVCGEKLVFRSEIDSTHVYSVVEYLLASDLAGRMTAVIASDTYSLSMECDRKYLMNFGNYSECEIKLRLASVILEDKMFEAPDKMRIDLSNTSETTVVVDNTIEMH